jgi:predicted SAM-dependent methyltransferase
VLQHDLSKGIRFADNYFDLVYHSHVLEHFSKPELLAFIRECYRVLVPGGHMRVVVPDLEVLAKLYLMNLEAVLRTASFGIVDEADCPKMR